MVARLIALGMDALDPPRLTAFWAAALRWTVRDGQGDGLSVVVEPTATVVTVLVECRAAPLRTRLPVVGLLAKFTVTVAV